jgi:TonB family protein
MAVCHADRGPRHFVMTPMTHLVRRWSAARFAIWLATGLAPLLAHGQVPAAAAAASAGHAEPPVSERVKKDAASPLYWIRLNAQKADAPPPRPAPRISEIKPTAPRPVAGPAGGGGGSPPTAVATTGGGVPASTGAATAVASGGRETATPLATPSTLAAPAAAAPPSPGAALAGPTAAQASQAAQAAIAAATEEADEPLALVQANEPEFPPNVMRRLRKGTVQVRFEVQSDGSVANATVVQTSNRTLNQAAIDAVGGWRFKPVRGPRSAVVDLGFDLDG